MSKPEAECGCQAIPQKSERTYANVISCNFIRVVRQDVSCDRGISVFLCLVALWWFGGSATLWGWPSELGLSEHEKFLLQRTCHINHMKDLNDHGGW